MRNSPLSDALIDVNVGGCFWLRSGSNVISRLCREMSPTLDPGLLRDVRSRADELDLYLEVGVGKVNT